MFTILFKLLLFYTKDILKTEPGQPQYNKDETASYKKII